MRTAPFWSNASLVSASEEPRGFQVSLEDMVSETGQLVEGDLSSYGAKGTPFEPGDILFGKLRPYLAKYWLADRTGTAGGDIHVYRPEDGMDPRYLKYVVGSRNFVRFAEAASKGTKMPRAEWMSLREYPIVQFAQAAQQEIALYLDRETSEIDAVLARMDRLSAVLRARVRTASRPKLCSASQQDSADSAADAHSPLSGIPEHWDRTKFGYDFTESAERNGDDPPGPLLSISEYRGVELNTRTEGQQASLTSRQLPGGAPRPARGEHDVAQPRSGSASPPSPGTSARTTKRSGFRTASNPATSTTSSGARGTSTTSPRSRPGSARTPSA